ncbi:hypothetical protein [Deinococcus sp. Leaf326]|uniref:hypothetical protein n=1 Tax=Deinococcus sp. Leaf326 TaxID=1736338 RepID=UPI0006F31DE1|nr:hypothetical protein [Deinococcus sp. Leaf326]KQR33159.1 hypothetical protein ASF71_16850 [Deinococcus sp. Leaf326]
MTQIASHYTPLSTAAPNLHLESTAMEMLLLRLRLGLASKEPRSLSLLGLRQLLAGFGDSSMPQTEFDDLERWVEYQFSDLVD